MNIHGNLFSEACQAVHTAPSQGVIRPRFPRPPPPPSRVFISVAPPAGVCKGIVNALFDEGPSKRGIEVSEEVIAQDVIAAPGSGADAPMR